MEKRNEYGGSFLISDVQTCFTPEDFTEEQKK